MKYYSPKQAGFYDDEIHPQHTIPDDAVPLKDNEYKSLFEQQATGKQIVYAEGKLSCVETITDSDRLKSDLINRIKSEAKKRIANIASLQDQILFLYEIIVNGSDKSHRMMERIIKIQTKQYELIEALDKMSIEDINKFKPTDDKNWN